MASKDFDIPVPASLEAASAMPIDEAIEAACRRLGLPVLGGPSGRGWSYFSTAQRCPHLFATRESAGAPTRAPAVPLQVGALYHALQALYYGAGIRRSQAVANRGMANYVHVYESRTDPPPALELPEDAADQLLSALKKMADPSNKLIASINGGEPIKMPSAAVIYEAERLFDAHTAFYGEGREDVTPLAVEWLAVNADLGYTCRYDAIARLDERDPLVSSGQLPAGSVVIFERKTASHLSQAVTEGWTLDGEVLGELLNWGPSGCERIFGSLAGVIVDVVTKGKTPQFHRVLIPPTIPAVAEHARWIRYVSGEMQQWAATDVYPKRYASCFDRWGQCSNWNACAHGG